MKTPSAFGPRVFLSIGWFDAHAGAAHQVERALAGGCDRAAVLAST
jgi:hypothetical protein